MRSSRRAFLKRATAVTASLGAAGAALADGGRLVNDRPRTRPGVALQLYSVRDDCANEFRGTVEAVARMGYEGVEFAGYYGWSAEDLRALLDDTGLKVAGTHIGLGTLLGDELEKTVEFNATIGNRFLIVPGLEEKYTATHEGWIEAAETFNEIADRLKPHNMRTGYHNHMIEFLELGGELPWDTFFKNTSNDVVMQVDIGNAMHGGGDPIPYIARYPGRALTIHCKEFSAEGKPVVVGEGDVPWREVFDLCETVGKTEWYIIEQESYAHPPLECAEMCLDYFRKMGKLA